MLGFLPLNIFQFFVYHFEQYFFVSEVADGLCCQLSFPAPRIAPTRPDLSHDTQQVYVFPNFLEGVFLLDMIIV